MFEITSEQINFFLAAFLYPLVRILAWLSADPLLGNRVAPVSIRVALAFTLTMVLAPTLPAPPTQPLLSGEGLLILFQQVVIGVTLGFVLRIVFAAVEFAGQFAGLQMGLSFATLFDPVNGAQTPVIAQFLMMTSVLVLFAMDGHYLVIDALVRSFHELPIGVVALSDYDFAAIVRWGGMIFLTGLQIALPVTAALLSANLAIGMMTRAAPQLNIFAVGFPLTLGTGFLVLYFSLGFLPQTLERVWSTATQLVLSVGGRP